MDDFVLSAAELRARGGGKWRRYPPDILPAFVADMDFKVAPAVQAALRRFTDHQDYTYGLREDHLILHDAFAGWMARRHGWSPDPALTIDLDDVVQGIVATLVAYSDPNDGVVIQTPIYPPFLRVIASTGRRVVENSLVRSSASARFSIDFDGLREASKDARILLLCNPHNPTGRVLERGELGRIAEIAAEHDLTIVADEIHADVVYPGSRHVPMETIPGVADRTVTLTSATKGFNIPGARTAVVHFGSEVLKSQFDAALPEHILGRPSRFGLDATIAAWTGGETWLTEVLAYLQRNRELVSEWAASRGCIGYAPPEASFLAWLDCRDLTLPTFPYDFFLESAKVALSDGRDFGAPGTGHVRLNFATSIEILREILERMSRALDTAGAPSSH
jgi:cystathionine beta-lyase